MEAVLKDDGAMMQGRLTPSFINEIFQAMEAPRLHTSLLYIPSTKRLTDKLKSHFFGLRDRFGMSNWWRPSIVCTNHQHYFFDVGASVYGAISGTPFPPSILDRYTHLNCGTMLEAVVPLLAKGKELEQTHLLAEKDPKAVFQLWKEHDKYYEQQDDPSKSFHI